MKRIKFFFNGQQYFISKSLTIHDIIEYFNYTDSLFILEYNNKICLRRNWLKYKIENSDKIEVITIVGGG